MLEAYLEREPDHRSMTEYMLAQLTAVYVNAHLKEGAPSQRPIDFMPFKNPWPEQRLSADGYSDVDREVLEALL